MNGETQLIYWLWMVLFGVLTLISCGSCLARRRGQSRRASRLLAFLGVPPVCLHGGDYRCGIYLLPGLPHGGKGIYFGTVG